MAAKPTDNVAVYYRVHDHGRRLPSFVVHMPVLLLSSPDAHRGGRSEKGNVDLEWRLLYGLIGH